MFTSNIADVSELLSADWEKNLWHIISYLHNWSLVSLPWHDTEFAAIQVGVPTRLFLPCQAISAPLKSRRIVVVINIILFLVRTRTCKEKSQYWFYPYNYRTHRIPAVSELFTYNMGFFQSPAISGIADHSPAGIRSLNFYITVVRPRTTSKSNHLKGQ